MTGRRVLHAALPDDWARALAAGTYATSTRGRTVAAEGFLHASTPEQLAVVLPAFYADVATVVLLVLDLDAVESSGRPVRWERVPGAESPYPHVYGDLPVAAVGEGCCVVATVELTHDPDRPWTLPDLTAYGVG